MTIRDLEKMIEDAKWFSNLSRFIPEEGTIAIKTLDAWRSESITTDKFHEEIANQMRWLPSQPFEPDPIHGETLKKNAKEMGLEIEMNSTSIGIYKRVIVATRNIKSELLKVGNHDFNLPSKASIGYSGRLAACEVVMGKPDFWCRVFTLFCKGFLPWGIMPDGKLVVF